MEKPLEVEICRASEGGLDRQLTLALERRRHLFPAAGGGGRVLLKPNLNSNMNALTGNTTDLRILGGVIRFLKDEGYGNIVVGEGTNSGFYRNKIGVIARLKVDELAGYYGVEVKDLNYADPVEIEFADGVKAHVARECLEADLLINLPKLKTHFEVGMSVCLKNMMGCLVGQENKKKTHMHLAENILMLNRYIRPHLHVVDALVAMEGLGPTRGEPVRLDTLVIGEDPFLVDLACAKIAGFDWRQVLTLALADKKGMLTASHLRYVEALDVGDRRRPFKPPRPGPLAAFIHSPKRQRYFARVRNTSLFSYLADTGWFGHLLFKTGLRQDVFLKDEMVLRRLGHERQKCAGCGTCNDVCPLCLDVPKDLDTPDSACIKCLYCFSVCPEGAIRFDGRPGFYSEQIKQYGKAIRSLYGKKGLTA